MSLPKKILLLVLLLIVFIAACVYVKIEQLKNELNPTATSESVTQITQPANNEEETPLIQEEELKKVNEPIAQTQNDHSLETQQNSENNTEEVKEEKKEDIELVSKVSLQEQINKVLENNSIMFQRMSYNVTNKSQEIISKIAKIIIDNPHIKIEIAGHTDAKGDDSFNQMISEQRASSVKNLLIELGVDENRLSAKGYGETMPLVPNDSEGYSLTNRRVEFNIIEE